MIRLDHLRILAGLFVLRQGRKGLQAKLARSSSSRIHLRLAREVETTRDRLELMRYRRSGTSWEVGVGCVSICFRD